ncbi:MAG: hypothetical protein OQK12_14965 [Motiliproteus sp.]|nr:hypothetical protein [Motiliproteus sp.]MCW9052508.1 hypothetical protein [Motiliproteus sp.]
MKLIEEFYSEIDAEEASQKLRKRGVLTHITSRRSYRLSRRFTGAVKVGLWAVLDNQFEDACKILTNKQCKVRHPLTEEQMKEMEAASKDQTPSIILRSSYWHFCYL